MRCGRWFESNISDYLDHLNPEPGGDRGKTGGNHLPRLQDATHEMREQKEDDNASIIYISHAI